MASTPANDAVRRAHRIVLRGLPLLGALVATQATPAWGDEFRIGVLGHRGPEKTLAEWRPTTDYLHARLPEHRFVIVPQTLEGMREAVRQRRLDFVVTNGAIYVDMEVRFGAIRTATLINPAGGDAGARFGAVIFTRADRADITELADLKGKTFMAVSPRAWGGWLMPRHELERHGVRPEDFKELRYSGYPFGRLVEAVMSGEVDAGAVRTDLLETLAAEGSIGLDELRVLNPHQVLGFPYLLSTPLYPEHAFARLPHVDNEVARQVTAQLLLVPPGSPAAHSARVAGWTTPLDYQPIHRVLRDLKATPYEDYGDVSLFEAARQHWREVLSIALLLLVLTGISLVNRRLARRLSGQSAHLERQVRERTRALAASEERLRLVVDNAPAAVWDWDIASDVTEWSGAFTQMFGWPGGRIDEKSEQWWSDRIHPDDRGQALSRIRDALERGGSGFRTEYRFRKRDGRWVHTLDRGEILRDASGQPYRVIGAMLDISQRKRAERAMRRSESRYRALFDHAGVGIAEIDTPSGRFLRINQRYCDIVGYSAEEMLGLNFQAITHPDDLQADLDNMARLAAGEIRDFEMEKRYQRRDGCLVWVHLAVTPLWAPGGSPTRHIAVVEDIDARKRAEAAAEFSQAETERLLAKADQARRGLLSVIEDERAAQAALRDSEQRFRTIFEQAAVGVALIDSHSGRFIRINRRYCEMVGYRIEEMSNGKTFQEITHPDDLPADLDNMKRLIDGDIREFSIEKRYYHKNGSIVWVNLTVSPTWSPGEEPRHHVAVVEDITERYRLNERQWRIQRALATLSGCNEAMLRAAEEQQVLDELCLRVVHSGGYRLAWIGLAEQDQERSVRPVAQAGYEEGYLDTLDITWSDEPRGQGPTGTAIRTGRPATTRDIHTNPKFAPWREEALKRGYGSSVALPLREKDWVFGALNLYAAEPDAFDKAELGLLEELADDISYGLRTVRARKEKEHAEAALRKAYDGLEDKVAERTRDLAAANERLQELDRLKSLFIASMSHELRTPLNSIIGFTGMLVGDMAGPISDRQRDYLQRVNRAGKHLLSLITEVIDISKIEAGKLAVSYRPFLLDEAVAEAVGQVETEAQAKGLELVTEVPAGVAVHDDRKRLLQCLLNFLSNAVKYTEGGTIRVDARAAGNQVELSVSDAGDGIAESDLDRLFQPFARLESALMAGVGGTGLGLYLTRKLAREVLGGDVGVTSRVGEGSTFSLRIPRRLTTRGEASNDGA